MRVHEVQNTPTPERSGVNTKLYFGLRGQEVHSAQHQRWKRFRLALVFVLVFFLCGFLIWGPVFRLQAVHISGLENSAANIEVTALDFAVSQRRLWFFPFANLLTMDHERLKSFLQTNILEIKSVESVRRDWPGGLAVEVEPRLATFVVENLDAQRVILAQDGVRLKILKSEDVLPSGVSLIRWSVKVDDLEKDEGLERNMALQLFKLQKAVMGAGLNVHEIILLPIMVLESQNSETSPTENVDIKSEDGFEAQANTELKNEVQNVSNNALDAAKDFTSSKGKRIIKSQLSGQLALKVSLSETLGKREFILFLDQKTDAETLEKNLRFVISDVSADKLKRLVYLDLRYDSRGFLCLSGSLCASQMPYAEVISVLK